MVHALKLVHNLLIPGGLLIDLHPSGQPYIIEITVDGETHQVGELQEKDNYVEYFQANQALQQVIQAGLFSLIRQGKFHFLDYASNLEELRTYLVEKWDDVIWPDEAARRANDLIPAGTIDSIPAAMREDVIISRLLKLAPP